MHMYLYPVPRAKEICSQVSELDQRLQLGNSEKVNLLKAGKADPRFSLPLSSSLDHPRLYRFVCCS